MRQTLILMMIALLLAPAPSIAKKEEAPTLKFGDALPANMFVELARVVNPAVVNISTKTLPKQRNRMYRDPFFEMLEQFYGYQSMPMNIRPQQSLGTGFIIREDGLIVTNNHVIAGADVIDVQLSEGKEKFYSAKLIGSDDRTDIALIKIEGKNFPTATLGSSTDAQVGEWVAAFGNPYGQGHTMTKGIISAKGRALSEINKFPMIQTDAPINPGNSGGPLVNTKGLVIGVNAAIDPRAQGIGFAIPIDEVKALLPQLEKLGHIRKAYLGVGMADLDPQAAMALGMKEVEGSVIVQVERSGPAAQAGVKPYDIITEFNGRKIKDSNELRDAVSDAPIGKEIKIKILREGKTKTLSTTLAERSEPKIAKQKNEKKKHLGGREAPFELGFKAVDANEELRKEFDLAEDVDRPVVVEVDRQSPAEHAGLLPGDVILDVNRKEVQSASEVSKNIKKGMNVLRVARENSVVFVMLEAR